MFGTVLTPSPRALEGIYAIVPTGCGVNELWLILRERAGERGTQPGNYAIIFFESQYINGVFRVGLESFQWGGNSWNETYSSSNKSSAGGNGFMRLILCSSLLENS